MADISIQFSEEDLRLLVQHAFIGNWVLTATQEEKNKKVEDFFQKILKTAKGANADIDIEKDRKSNQYFTGVKLEEKYLKDIELYNEDTFYEELVDRLTKRDIAKTHTLEEVTKMNDVKFNDLFDKIQNQYIAEIEKNDLRNIIIADRKAGDL